MSLSPRTKDWMLAGVIMILGLVLRLIYLNQYSASPLFSHILGPDAEEYDSWAHRILTGQLLWPRVDIHAPLYPYYLAGLYWLGGMQIYPVRLLQLLLTLAAFLPLFFELRRYYRKGVWYWLPLFYLLLAAIYTPVIFYTGELISEALMLPLLCLALAWLYRGDRTAGRVRRWWHGGAGFCCGLAAITHPLSFNFAVLAGAFLLWRGWRNKRLSSLVLFAIASLLPVAAVSIYNSSLEQTPVLVQKNSGYNFYLGNNPEATGGCYIWPGPEWDKVHGDANRAAKTLGITKDQYFFKQMFAFITEHPLQWTELLVKKTLYVWNWRELAAGPDLPGLKYFTPLMSSTQWLPGVIMMLALAGLALVCRERRDLWRGRYLLLMVFGGWLALTLTVTGGRYRLMLLPGVLFLTAWMISYLWQCRGRRLVWGMLVLLLAGVAVWLPQPQVDDATEIIQGYTILGEAYLNDGNREKALFYLQTAEQGMSRWSRSYNLLGRFYEESQPRLAEKYFIKAIECSPDEAYGYMNRGNLRSMRGDFVAAEPWFKVALERGADDPQVLYNAGYFELRRGKRDQARELLMKCLELKPEDRRALNAVAVIALMDGKPREAIPWIQRALRLEPDNPGLMVNMAAAYGESGNRESAIVWINKALAIDPRHSGALALQRQLK